MQLTTEVSARFLNTERTQAAVDWDSLLCDQVDLSFPYELHVLSGLWPWQDALQILDAGCGNGYYTSRLHAFFPQKKYVGIDTSPQLVALAKRRHPTLSFAVEDVATYAPQRRFDVILMRFFVQHIHDFRVVLDTASRLLDSAGCLIVVETDLDNSSLPGLPVFSRMLHAFAEVSAAHGSVKQLLLRSPQRFIQRMDAAWTLERDELVTIPQIGPFAGSKTLAIYRLWVELCELSEMFPFDFHRVRDELETWARNPRSFGAIALRLIVARRLARC